MTIVNKFIGYMFHNQVTVQVCKINFRYFEEMNIKGKYTHYGFRYFEEMNIKGKYTHYGKQLSKI